MSFEDIHNKELQCYNEHLAFLKKLQTLCINNYCTLEYNYQDKKLLKNRHKPYEPLEKAITSYNYSFTIEEIVEGTSGCHQCQVKYPSLHLYGHCMYPIHGIAKSCEIALKTWNTFSCKCDQRSSKDPMKMGLFFEMYYDDNYSQWEHIYLKYNIGYHQLFHQSIKQCNFSLG